MNRLSTRDRAAIIQALCEGNSIRAACRMTGAAKDTVTRLLVATGRAAADYQDAVLRDLPCKRIQCDEIWGFVFAKARTVAHARHTMPEGAGDAWIWTAICRDTKLVPSWLVGRRTVEEGLTFMTNLASRMASRVQITTDGLAIYLDAVPFAFRSNVDFGQVVKHYGVADKEDQRRYSPAVCTGATRRVVMGDLAEREISTSHVERSNLSMRMGMRRLTRLTNAFSKKFDNLDAAVALHFLWRNFAVPHGSLKGATPAKAAGVSRYRWTAEEIASLLDDPQYADALKVQMRHNKPAAA